jgi:amino acid transporter
MSGLLRRVARAVIGAPLSTAESDHQRLPKVLALPIFSSDALSSVAYATEEILLALCAGAAAVTQVPTAIAMPIAAAIVVLLVVVTWSYTQTIEAYPGGGGAYIVAKENLGLRAALVAGASLLIDYVLTVSVSIAAGVAAITSACNVFAPRLLASSSPVVEALGAAAAALDTHRVAIGVLFVLGITLANLRGVKESGKIFAIPTYAFIFAMAALVLYGTFAVATGAVVTVPQPAARTDLGVLLFLRAFASGCSA